MKKIKTILKNFLPFKVQRLLRRIEQKTLGAERKYKGKSNSEIFNKIYQEGIWGRDLNGYPTSGSGSHTFHIVLPYIEKVNKLLLQIKPDIIIDIGCGDFNIGKNFVNYCGKYIACDVSSIILEKNKKQYTEFKNLEFRELDLTNDKLPVGDIAFVRQVLQHLSNDDIKKFVEKINEFNPFKFLLVTEHIPLNSEFTPNIDKPSGPNIRIEIGSGVILHEKPFNLTSKSHSIFTEVSQDVLGIKSVIRSTLYEF
jgi:hypothetical protein